MAAADKAFLQINGEILLARQIRRGKRFTVLRGAHPYDIGVPQLSDIQVGMNPLGGLISALRDCRHESLALTPVDVPSLRDETLATLGTRSLPVGADALAARSENRLHPLVGVFSNELAASLERYLSEGNRSVRGYREQVSAETSAVDGELHNINTPDDFVQLQEDDRFCT